MLNLREGSDSALSDGLVSTPRNRGRELPCTGAREMGDGSKISLWEQGRAWENTGSLPARLWTLELSPKEGDITEGNRMGNFP